MESLLSEKASMKFIDFSIEMIKQLATDLLQDKEMKQRLELVNKRFISQQEVYIKYDCCAKDIKRWLELGLARRKQGKKWIYDSLDIEQIFELEKE